MATIVKTEIQSPVIYRITDKATHEHFYLVKSDSQPNTYYEVHWNAQALSWQCNCPATKPCKHERAVNEVLKIRRACLAAQMGGDTPTIVARMQREEEERCSRAYANRLHNGVSYERYSQAVESQNSEESLARRECEREEDRKLAVQEREVERLTRDQYTAEFGIY